MQFALFVLLVSYIKGLDLSNNQEHFDKEMSLIFLCIGLLFWISSVFFFTITLNILSFGIRNIN